MDDSNTLSNVERDIRAEFARLGFGPLRTHSLATSESLVARVSAGLGWSIHRRSLRGKIPDVATVPIEDFAVPIPVTLLHRASEAQPHILEVARRIREVATLSHPAMRPLGSLELPF